MTPRNLIVFAILSIFLISASCYSLRSRSELTKALLKEHCDGDCIFGYPMNAEACSDSEDQEGQAVEESGEGEIEDQGSYQLESDVTEEAPMKHPVHAEHFKLSKHN